MKSFLSQLINVVILMILDNYPFLDYLPIGALDGATEVGPSFKFWEWTCIYRWAEFPKKSDT